MDPTHKVIYSFKALGGPCALHFHASTVDSGQALAKLAEIALKTFEQRFSRYRDDSLVGQINAMAGSDEYITLDEQAAALVDYAFSAFEQSEGLFDISSGVLRKAWDFKTGRVPEPADIDALLPLVGLNLVDWQRPQLRLTRAGMQLDFGGFGKEYAADMLAQLLLSQGVTSGYVDLAGDIAIIGPNTDDEGWPIGISNPQNPGQALATVNLGAGAIASSGTYQRFIDIGGARYSHILNPKTGWPIQTYAGVSVIQPSCLVAGTLCSIAMLKGEPDGHEWLEEMGVNYLAILDDGSVFGSLEG